MPISAFGVNHTFSLSLSLSCSLSQWSIEHILYVISLPDLGRIDCGDELRVGHFNVSRHPLYPPPIRQEVGETVLARALLLAVPFM